MRLLVAAATLLLTFCIGFAIAAAAYAGQPMPESQRQWWWAMGLMGGGAGFLVGVLILNVADGYSNELPNRLGNNAAAKNLQPCSDCGRMVSKLAIACPQCGRPFPPQPEKLF